MNSSKSRQLVLEVYEDESVAPFSKALAIFKDLDKI